MWCLQIARRAGCPSAAERTPSDREKLQPCFLNQLTPEAIRLTYDRVVTLREQQRALTEDIPTVMQELQMSRDSFACGLALLHLPAKKQPVTSYYELIFHGLHVRGLI